jgi:urea transporter
VFAALGEAGLDRLASSLACRERRWVVQDLHLHADLVLTTWMLVVLNKQVETMVSTKKPPKPVLPMAAKKIQRDGF